MVVYLAILAVLLNVQAQSPPAVPKLANSVDISARDLAEQQLARERSVRIELAKALDFRKLKVGDHVTAELMESLEFDGHTVATRGAKIQGRVFEVRREEGNSAVIVAFERAIAKGVSQQLTATIKAIGPPLAVYSAHWASERSAADRGDTQALSIHGRLASNAQGVWNLPGVSLEEAGPQRSRVRTRSPVSGLPPRTQMILRVTMPR
jgi:hypothetical protein